MIPLISLRKLNINSADKFRIAVSLSLPFIMRCMSLTWSERKKSFHPNNKTQHRVIPQIQKIPLSCGRWLLAKIRRRHTKKVKCLRCVESKTAKWDATNFRFFLNYFFLLKLHFQPDKSSSSTRCFSCSFWNIFLIFILYYKIVTL